jgi:hypothetical protein
MLKNTKKYSSLKLFTEKIRRTTNLPCKIHLENITKFHRYISALKTAL